MILSILCNSSETRVFCHVLNRVFCVFLTPEFSRMDFSLFFCGPSTSFFFVCAVYIPTFQPWARGKKKRMGEWARKKGRKKGPMGKSKKKRRNPLRLSPTISHLQLHTNVLFTIFYYLPPKDSSPYNSLTNYLFIVFEFKKIIQYLYCHNTHYHHVTGLKQD